MAAEELLTMGVGSAMVWVAAATLDDLKRAQGLGLNPLVQVAIQKRIAALEDSRRTRQVLLVAGLTLAVAVAALAVGIWSLIVAR
jgi:fucose 4-O-acetylase-like acetyltransferase